MSLYVVLEISLPCGSLVFGYDSSEYDTATLANGIGETFRKQAPFAATESVYTITTSSKAELWITLTILTDYGEVNFGNESRTMSFYPLNLQFEKLAKPAIGFNNLLLVLWTDQLLLQRREPLIQEWRIKARKAVSTCVGLSTSVEATHVSC
jgi:hypothetical protein